MSYCSLDEAWGNNNVVEKRKRRVTPPALKEEHQIPTDSRSYSRDINTPKDFNGPEKRFEVEPIKIEEDFSSQHENIEHMYKPAEFEKQFAPKNNSSSTITTSEMEWIKDQLQTITNKLASMNVHQVSSSSSASIGLPSDSNPTADIILYLSTGFLTIFLIDVLLKKRN